MANDEHGAALVFDGARFTPATRVIKAGERQLWLELQALRGEADVRIEREVAARTAEVRKAIENQVELLAAQRFAQLAQAFDSAATQLEQAALDLAQQIALRVIEASEPAAFFARAAEHLQAIVPAGSALRLHVHPRAAGELGTLLERLHAAGLRHVHVVPDESIADLRGLVVETRDGEIELGCATQLRRIVADVLQDAATPGAGDASAARASR